ncbi:GNAT family N-acetyltransferase [Promicromonospora soli]|uniref:GNAT family N-acetyltransferase n=1 Tax=Promicromonospora soli TaxID=2035533 RepID=A0A919G932_9MICO|nr:GNAT family N-acetyltransferase [Promicromonospora soli]GHH80258.1 GNAT family N-acetyltransferase [Promicromonospora soli]
MSIVDADRPVQDNTGSGDGDQDDAALDNPAWSSLTGAHAHLAEGGDLVRRYPTDVSPFAAVRSWDDPGVWDAIVDLVGYDAEFPAPPESVTLPPGWERGEPFEGVQLVETGRLRGRPDDEAVILGSADVPEMLDLVARAQPGPFLPRTYKLGRYIGIRRDGRLVAMAGERLRPAGWTEISAVATDERYRGQGLAARLVLDVVHHVHQPGVDKPGARAMLHAAADNTGAIRLYEKLGFTLRRRMAFASLRTPVRP